MASNADSVTTKSESAPDSAAQLGDNIPLADSDTTEEITELDILKLSLGSGNKARAATVAAAVQSGTQNPMSSTESIPYGAGAVSNSSSSPAQPSCKLLLLVYHLLLPQLLTLFICPHYSVGY